MKKSILLNWMPPAQITTPSPSMSVLKSYLLNAGYDVEIKYWNHILFDLQQEYTWNNDSDSIKWAMYLAYPSLKHKDNDKIANIKALLKSIKPQYLNLGNDFFDHHIESFSEKFINAVRIHINKLDLSHTLFIGMSVNLYQWITAAIIAEELKIKYPDIPIVIGGIGTKKAAITFLEAFPQFDIAMWGEGEYALSVLAEELNKKHPNLEVVPNIAHRNNGEILLSSSRNKNYIDLNSFSIRPNFDDFIESWKLIKSVQAIPALIVEGARGCHWNRCHFCYLNEGYKYRTKNVDTILDELKFLIKKYRVYLFEFTDNDMIGRNIENFNTLLDRLMLLKEEYPDFQIIGAEIITNGIDSKTIKKMALAGYSHVQIGYESASDSLLRKMEKKNSFASNLLFVKFARLYNIKVSGANILKNLFEEKESDITESIDNLHYLRFFIEKSEFQHLHSELAINSSSRYFKKVDHDKYWYGNHIMSSITPEKFINNKQCEGIFIELLKIGYNRLWDCFIKIDQHYIDNEYTYSLTRQNGSLILFTEYYNGESINEIEFEEQSLEWDIMKISNDKVISFDILFERLKSCPAYKHLDINTITDTLYELRDERLIYCPEDTSEIVSIINTHLLK